MCRHLAHLGAESTLEELLYAPCGLYEQSWAPRLQRYGTVNADGFGIGWYPPAEEGGAVLPARYRRAVPIWADQNLPDLARALRSGCVLAAVRDATPGTSQDESAAAPYAHGRWLLSHNGAVPSWSSLPDDLGLAVPAAELLELEARCDSALLWLLIHRRLADGEPAVSVLADLVPRIAAVRPGVRLNLLLTDGHRLAAVRHGDTLWYRAGRRGLLVASEPDATEGWQEVPDNALLTATAGAPPKIRPLTPPATPPAAPAAASERTTTA